MTPEPSREIRTSVEKQLEVGTWGAFFLWIGIALLAQLNWGVWLLGVSAIILGSQLIRRTLALRVERFWVVAGVLFGLGGVLHFYPLKMDIPLIPIICIAAGAGLLAKSMRRRTKPRHA